MRLRQLRSLTRRQHATPVARRHPPKWQSSHLLPSLLALFYLLRPLDCLLFVSCTPNDLTHIFASEPRFTSLPSREPPLAQRPAHQKAYPRVFLFACSFSFFKRASVSSGHSKRHQI